ncbi:ras association domain-containing protein 7 [Ditylenchus destructor]|uniref:Ras association domain-containing protein 7 n=1 Tax=Ditylenchus destructor TaxID=166010 RepID=A0AAD4NHH6_9BILA|nr:ras association domain-containing protein 7 [Ditylenchus destructor]
MEFLVYANGALRDISGVNESTTCAQIVYALAHATNQKGRFVLIVSFSNTDQEHRLTPSERPLEILRKCAQEGIDVSFELRKLDDQNRSGPKTGDKWKTDERDSTADTHSNNASTSSASSRCEEEMSGIPTPTLSAASSCTVLPSCDRRAAATLSNQISAPTLNCGRMLRPPPPSYNTIIEERCSSLTRNASAKFNHNEKAILPSNFAEIQEFSPNSLYCQTFSREDLKRFLKSQSEVLSVQRNELASMELALSNDLERELMQLKKQHNNLQTVLNSLRNAVWPSKVENERQESDRLNTAIDAMKTAIENKRRELHEILELLRTLELQHIFESTQQVVPEESIHKDTDKVAMQRNLKTPS